MYRYLRPLLICILVTPLFINTAEAQRPFERFQRESVGWRPDGRILREMFGEKDEDEDTEAKTREQEDNLWSRSTFGPRIEQPSPNRFRRPNPTDEDTPYNRSLFANSRNTKDYREDSTKPAKYSAFESRKKPHPGKLEVALTRSEDPDGLIVERISKSGAAYLAGIRQGDLLTEVGGLKVSSKEELASVLQILKDGDQMEFQYQRRGRNKTAIVQFGEAQNSSIKNRSIDDTSAPRKQNLVEYYSRPRKVDSQKSTSTLDDYFQRNASSRNKKSVPELENELNLDWDESLTPSTNSKRRNLSARRNQSEIMRLRNELEKKQREVEKLQESINKKAANSNSYSETELESLFDTDR